MGDVRFDRAYERLVAARDVTAVLRELSDDELVAALAGATSRPRGAYLVNVVATEVMNRLHRRDAPGDAEARADDRWRAALEQLPVYVLLLDRENRITFVNRVLAGARKEDYVGRPHGDFLPPEDRDRVAGIHRRVLESGVPATYEVGAATAMSRGRWFENRVAPLLDAAGRPRELILTVTDVTERKLADVTAARQRERLALLAEASKVFAEASEDVGQLADAIARSVATRIGDMAGVLLVSGDGEWVDLAAVHASDPERAEAVRALFSTRLRVGEGITGGVLASGRSLLVPTLDMEAVAAATKPEFRGAARAMPAHSLLVVPMLSRRGGRPLGVIAAARHVTPGPYVDEDRLLLEDLAERAALALSSAALRAELERRVTERTRDLARANQDLESFTYMASHDLRAPLRGVEALADFTLRDYAGQLDDEGKERLRSLHASARRMSQLIEDLLHLSRSGREALTATDVDVTMLTRAIGAEIAKEWRGTPVALHVEDGLVARADARLFRIALENVLRNAWKFTAKVAAPRVDVVRGSVGEIVVRDNGVGFDPTQAHRLFHAFERLHPPSQFEGTGIGLAIVRRIAERHGGRVWAEGEPGKGAAFHLALPTP